MSVEGWFLDRNRHLGRRQIGDKLATFEGTQAEKERTLQTNLNNIAKNSFNATFAKNMKALQENDTKHSDFHRDHKSLEFVPTFKIGNDTLTFFRNTPLATKCDIIAQFVTKNKDAKFSELQAEDRNKAYAVMSILSNQFNGSMMYGVCRSVTPQGQEEVAFCLTTDDGPPERSSMEFSFGDDGSLRVHHTGVEKGRRCDMEDDNTYGSSSEPLDSKSTVTVTADFEIGAGELEKISKTDYTKLDRNAVNDPMENQPDPDEASAKALGDFRFGPGAQISVSFSAELYPLEYNDED